MPKLEFIFSLLFLISFHCSQKIEINIGFNQSVDLTIEGALYSLEINANDIQKEDKFIAISTTPSDYLKPAYIYISSDVGQNPSPDFRNFSSQEIGRNIIYLRACDYYQISEPIVLNIFIKPLFNTIVQLEVYKGNNINLGDFSVGVKHKLNLYMFSDFAETQGTHLVFRQNFDKTKKVLFYALGENYNYFNLSVEFNENVYETKQIFENGYGAIVDITPNMFNENSFIIIKPASKENKYEKSKVEIGYEIIDNNEDEQREVEIMEHVYGKVEQNETCYKVKKESLNNKTATMLINTFTQGVLFRIKNPESEVLYSLDVFNNYFIKLPKEFYDENNYFCFKHITPHESEEEIFGEVSYDFQIYYDDELAKYQMYIMPLINGKIYTHSLNRGDIMIYRNNFYGDYTEGNDKKIYSANMLRIRGNPKLYGFICEDYPNNCNINTQDLKENPNIEKILPLNMYYINKRLNAEGNTQIDENGEATSELRKQYMTIVSCESDEKDPNKGECKYNIEINNERDEIQLMPETVFATSIIGSVNYFLIRLKDYQTTKYLKLHFTVLTGNAELYIYEDFECTNEVGGYNFSHIHRKEIIEIDTGLKENYYLLVKCSEPSFIQLKYETNAHYKGYKNLMPNEINIEPINAKTITYYNMYNPNYYYPLDNETRNNDFYYKIETMDCSMGFSDGGAIARNLVVKDFKSEKNKLYSYLSTYGFAALIEKNFHTSSEDDQCGLVIYNGEISENRPLLATPDMPLKSNLDNTYYIFPIIYDEDKDEGILINFKLYDVEDESNEDLYSSEILVNGKKYDGTPAVINNDLTVYISKEVYSSTLQKNNMGTITVKLIKKLPNRKYYITTNFMSAKFSPEYIYVNKNYKYELRPKSYKYFYSQIDSNAEGELNFGNLSDDVKVYAKIVEKYGQEEGYNWNGRVKLPEPGDQDLIEPQNGILKYNTKNIDENGCEIYILIVTNSSENNLIPITFNFLEYKTIDYTNLQESIDIHPTQMVFYKLIDNNIETNDNSGNLIIISTMPDLFIASGYIFISTEVMPSIDNNVFKSQKPGPNRLIIEESYLKEKKQLFVGINTIEATNVKITMYKAENIALQESPKMKTNLRLSDPYSISFSKTDSSKKEKILFYSLGENYNYFNMKVQFPKESETKNYEVKQIFENGFGAVVDFSSEEFKDIEAPKIEIILEPKEEKYKNRKVEVGYEIIDNNEDQATEISTLEHVYGMALEKETCYKVNKLSLNSKPATMLINTFTQGVLFRIKNSKNEVPYSLDVFNNYFIKLPKEFYDENNYFCFKHITPHESEEEIFGEVSYDFQIYYDDELAKYQMYIMPLINGKIYTHSLNRGDIMIYRNNFYGDYTEGNDKKIYSANMLRIRGNPKLYGFICEDYPNNCNINTQDLKENPNIEKILPLNMYYINKRLNAEGNTQIDENGEATSELRKQYMTIVSCESDEKDPNKGECKYNIEINNERDEIQLMPETVFATSIIGSVNYFLIRLKDYQTTKYLKLHFTVLTGNAELYIYEDFECKNEIKDYKFSHIHRKEIIEFTSGLKENYYLLVKCSEPSFIQLKYETDAHYKGYNNLIPNEINIEPINNNSISYYNLYNPNYYYPLNNEERNKDFYYRLETMDCSMYWGHVDTIEPNLTEKNFFQEKNKLYSYLSTYGFGSQINEYFHTSSKYDLCGVVIYNGEIDKERPLLITSDMPHKSTFENTYYVFPIIYDKDNDQGILMEFNVYDYEDLKDDDLYTLTYSIEGKDQKKETVKISHNKPIYLDKAFYGNYLENNMIGNLYITLTKKYPQKKYYVTTNIMSSKMSPEYINPNQDITFTLRTSSSKYFYSPLSKDRKGTINFKSLPNTVKVFAKIIPNDKVEEGYNWNKRVKLPEEGDPDLLPIKDGKIEYTKSKTENCTSGCEIYFHIKSDETTGENLITIAFDIKEEIPKDDTDKPDDDAEGSNVWIIIVVVFAILIIAIVILVLIMRKKRIYSTDIDNKDINELSMPLE